MEVVRGVVVVDCGVKRYEFLIGRHIVAQVDDIDGHVVFLEQFAQHDVVCAVLLNRAGEEADDALLLRLVEPVLECKLRCLYPLDELALAVRCD
ncbi:hypothetical protein BOVATA_032120 [Babesia ovata]|uniref:Uncharacterized protein n=1 Tax=Babesia ovata TaxID=189622 RepID=A0A2H6KFI2_9APIC|nr:uncharacterized protein BOVATA_032120 [Babesia ovata]GBE61719.1 hypothetical protein BOVATA_032120 [Babesia ovata]